jgi:hypothetical protein
MLCMCYLTCVVNAINIVSVIYVVCVTCVIYVDTYWPFDTTLKLAFIRLLCLRHWRRRGRWRHPSRHPLRLVMSKKT